MLTRETAQEVEHTGPFKEWPLTVLVEANEAYETYQVSSIPHTVLLNAQGGTEIVEVGYAKELIEELERKIKTMLPG